MTALSGTNVAAKVVPFTDTDIYETHDALYGKGGWREVDNTTIRDAIPTARRSEGMVVFVRGDRPYQLGSDLTTWTAISLTGPTGATGATGPTGATGATGSVASLTNAHILVGNGSNVPTDVAMSGDATIANTGAVTLNWGRVAARQFVGI